VVARPVGQVLLRWDPEEYSRVDLGIAGMLTPTIDANSAYLLQAWTHARWRLLRWFGIVGEVTIYDLQRSGEADGSADHERTLRARTGVELWARDGMVIRLMGGLDQGNPGGGSDDYLRLIGLLDTAFAW
jgi:hypothetical protein